MRAAWTNAVSWGAPPAMVLAAVWFASQTPRARHEATVDRPTIRALKWFDGAELERAGGRRWFIMRTGGRWR